MAKSKSKPVELSAADYEPLLVAISSRAVDTCLMGAKCLALLEDPRAFGLLMQLSREDNADVRLETCRSLAQLGDRRAVDRLCNLLADEDLKVRDAAFSALESVSKNDPLVAAEHGLASSFEDTRRRGLETLVRFAKRSKHHKADSPVLQLLSQTLSDSNESVRMETFKFILNSKIGGGEDATLRFLLGSVFADVRREVLNEVMAEDKQLWQMTMMFGLLNDPDQGIRGDAFAYLEKKYDKQETGWLQEAVISQHVDIRKRSCERLIEIGDADSQVVLANAINDAESEVRQLALKSLIASGATDSLVTALESSHQAVRLAAAQALAQNGDVRCAEVLRAATSQPFPEDSEEQQQVWQTEVVAAIGGLSMLGDASDMTLLVELCSSKNDNVRYQAATALRWTADVESQETLKPLLRHEDARVRYHAAMASALHGDMVSARLVLTDSEENPLQDKDRLLVAVALGGETENQLVQMLDLNDIGRANAALIILLCRDWLNHDGTPRRIVAALAARDARIRLIAAKALQAFHDESELVEVILEVFNDRAENEAWQVTPEVLRSVANMLVFSKPHVQCRTIGLLNRLKEVKQAKWDFAWEWFSTRFESEIASSAKKAERVKLVKPDEQAEVLNQLAFGTYVGLSREQGGYHFNQYDSRFGWRIPHVRNAALRRLLALANQDEQFRAPAVSVVTHTCGDPLHLVRFEAYEVLQELGVSDQDRAEIAISTGIFDMAVNGLSLLTASASAAKRKEILTEAVLNQRRNIATEAAKMLRDDIGSVKTCEVCLKSSSIHVGAIAIEWVAEDYQEAPAKKLLRSLAADSVPAIQGAAISALVNHRDEKTFGIVTEILKNPNPALPAKTCFNWLQQLRDPKTPDFLIALLDDRSLDLPIKTLMEVTGEFRDASSVPALLKLMERSDLAAEVSKTVRQISGFDQRIDDPTDALPDRDWMKGEHPRHGNLLADLLERTIELGLPKLSKPLIAPARWCLTDEVNESLSRLTTNPDDAIRHEAIAAVSFRGEKRGASVDSLNQAINHSDPMTQFLAAEGLAKAGHDEGIQVLMSAVEMMEDLRLRQRAVLALGNTANERVLDLLLKLVTHDAHALQDSAAEAIGHLGQADQRQKIFGILQTLVTREGPAGERAIIGLRHMNTPEGWDVIRSKSKTNSHSLRRAIVLEQLGYDQSETTQDLLVDLLERYSNDLQVQLSAARRSFGADSVVPDVAFLKGRHRSQSLLSELEQECLDRVCELADANKIFELVGKCPNIARPDLTQQLLMLDPLPIKEAVAAVESSKSTVVELAARVIGRGGDKKHGKLIGGVLAKKFEQHASDSQKFRRQNETPMASFYDAQGAVDALIWAAGQLGGCEKTLLQVVMAPGANEHFATMRRIAMSALDGGNIDAATEKRLTELQSDFDPAIRMAATMMLATRTKAKLDEIGASVLSDRFAFASLAINEELDLTKTLQNAASSPHYQPRSLLRLAKAGDVKTLATVAEDASLELNTRLGAIEGLAKMANAKAEKALVKIGNDEKADELRKAAWRGLRRSKRAGAKS